MTAGEELPPEPPEDPEDPEPPVAETREERRRRLARVFGEVLPEQTSDDAPDGTQLPANDADAWLRAQVPPHHG